MKKIIIIISILILFTFIKKEDYYVIPNDAIRLRIIANSNNTYDQYIKNKVKQGIEEEIENILKPNTIEKSRILIKENINQIEEKIKKILEEENYKEDFNIEYGNNYFPEKEYKNVKYEAGEYESLVITLGNGEGDNWWCVLFPPICSFEENNDNNIEYSFYIKEIFNKYIK